MKNLFSNLKERESTLLGVAIIGVALYLRISNKADNGAFFGLLSTGCAFLGLSFKNPPVA